MNKTKVIHLPLEMTDDEFWALAEFVKRVGWLEIRGNATNDDEAHNIKTAISALQSALAENGYSPR